MQVELKIKKQCYYLCTTTRWRKLSDAKLLYPPHASLQISIPDKQKYLIKGIIVGPDRSGISKVSFFSVAGYTNPLRGDREMAVFLQNLDLKRNTKLRVDGAVQWRNVKEISR